MIGIKAMHGSRDLVISENILSKVDLWGIFLGPGSSSHGTQAASAEHPGRAANTDGSIMVANNIIADYGYGHEYWNWGGAAEDRGSSYAIRIDKGQLPGNPPISEVLIQGNIVSDPGRQGILIEGKVTYPPPRYRYALHIEQKPSQDPRDHSYPRDVRVLQNLFQPGSDGISNVPVSP
jgi:hypothetical protein